MLNQLQFFWGEGRFLFGLFSLISSVLFPCSNPIPSILKGPLVIGNAGKSLIICFMSLYMAVQKLGSVELLVLCVASIFAAWSTLTHTSLANYSCGRQGWHCISKVNLYGKPIPSSFKHVTKIFIMSLGSLGRELTSHIWPYRQIGDTAP